MMRRLVWAFPLLAAPLAAQDERRDSLPGDTTYLMPEIVATATRGVRGANATSPIAASVTAPTSADRAAGRVAADLLRDIAGVHVQQTSAGQGAVILRGLIGNQVLLLVNGIPLNNGTYRDGPGQYLATIDPETIERIDVIRGPASVLYGSDAQGGVVNLITRPHPSAEGWTMRGTFQATTSNGGVRGRLSAGWGSPTLNIGMGGTLQQAGSLRAGGNIDAQSPTGFTAEGLDARISYHPNPIHSLTVGVEHFALHNVPRYDRYVDFRAPAVGRDAEHIFEPQTRQLAFARYRAEPGRPSLLTIEATASLVIQREGRRRRRLEDNGLPATILQRTRDDVYTPGVSLVGSSLIHGGHRSVWLTWGGEAYRDHLSSRGRRESLAGTSVELFRSTQDGRIATGRFPDGATMDRVGVFLSADAEVVPRVRLSVGGRWSGFRSVADVGLDLGGAVENEAAALTGQIGAVVTIAAPLSIALRLAQGFRAPNLYDLTNVGSVPGGVVLPNPNAQPEESLSSEASVRLHDKRTAIDVTVYRTVIDGFIDRVVWSFAGDTLFDGERVFQGRNVATARVAGIEIEALRVVGPILGRATLLYTHGEQTGGDGGVEPMAKIPPLQGTVSLRWRPPGRQMWVAYQLAWATRQDRLANRDLRDPRIPDGGTLGYTVHSLTFHAQVTPSLSASAGIENIADALYRSHASGVDSPGRHVWAGVTLFQGM
ncbi:MAG: TonB-dependent receptor [Gemmatimonadales bacterium]